MILWTVTAKMKQPFRFCDYVYRKLREEELFIKTCTSRFGKLIEGKNIEISFAYSCTKIAVLNFLKKLWKGNCGRVLLSDTEAFIPERSTTTK